MNTLALIVTNDADIVQEYVSGDKERAATAFVRKYQNFVYSTALRYLQSHDDADDVAQEVFIKALEKISSFRGDSNLKTWLYRITINTCTNLKRKNRFFSLFKSIGTSESDDEELIDITDNSPAPDQRIENEEFNKKFSKMLAKLPEKQRETFALRYFEEMPYEEISKVTGTSVGGLKANYFQAVSKLAKILEKDLK